MEGDINQLVLPGMGQLLGIVTQMFGYDRILVKCSDGAGRVCRISGKMKRRVWIKNGDVVLVALHSQQQPCCCCQVVRGCTMLIRATVLGITIGYQSLFSFTVKEP